MGSGRYDQVHVVDGRNAVLVVAKGDTVEHDGCSPTAGQLGAAADDRGFGRQELAGAPRARDGLVELLQLLGDHLQWLAHQLAVAEQGDHLPDGDQIAVVENEAEHEDRHRAEGEGDRRECVRAVAQQ